MNAPTDPQTDQIDAAFRDAQRLARKVAKERHGVVLLDFTKEQPRAVSDWLVGHAESFEQRRITTCRHAHLTTQVCWMLGWKPNRASCARCYAHAAEALATSAAKSVHFDCVFCGRACGFSGPIPIVAAVPPTIVLLGGACASCAGLRAGV